jgi:penicillin-binding protein 2
LSKWGYSDKKIAKGISASQCFAYLRKTYKVRKSLSSRDARKIFVIRNEIATNGFTRYIPITVAKDVSNKTIAVVEESEIKGASISSQYKRYYPNGTYGSPYTGIHGQHLRGQDFILCRQAGIQRH